MDAWMEKGPEVRSESETTRDGVCLAPYANRAPRSTSIYKLDRKVRRVRLELHGRASRRRAPARYIPSPSMGARRLLPSRSKGDRDFWDRQISRNQPQARRSLRGRHFANPMPHAFVVAPSVVSRIVGLAPLGSAAATW